MIGTKRRTNRPPSLMWQTKHIVHLVLLGLCGVNALMGIPGTTRTKSGYDTEMGQDAMCWSSVASSTPEFDTPSPDGALVKNFAMADQVKLHSSCPYGTWLTAHAPPEFSQPGFRPRTLEWYNFTVKGRLSLEALSDIFVASDTGSKAAVSILACDTVTAGFCSPFVHEQSNIRLFRANSTMKTKVGDRHGGTHVHAPAVILDIPVRNIITSEFEIQVPMIVNDPGIFFVVGTLQFFTGDTIFTPIRRYDVASALNDTERLIFFQESPTILKTSERVLTLSYICIGLVSLVLVFLLGATIQHRSHQVMQIAQADFLIVFLGAGLVATLSCVLLEPRSDLWCNLVQPMIMIPLQLFYAIILGRLWRINSVVSPLLRDRLARSASQKGQQSLISKLWIIFRSFFLKGNSLRRTVSASKVVWIVTFCTVPQVCLQIPRWFLQPQSKKVELNDDQSVGRYVCDDGKNHARSLDSYSLYLLLLMVMVLLIMAHVARQLPSLLNESAVIYECTLLSVFLLVLGEGLIAVTNGPTTSPDVPYLIHIALVLSITLIASCRTMVPKLKMVWSGQEVLVSQLVEDQKQTLRKANMSRGNSRFNVTGLQEDGSIISPSYSPFLTRSGNVAGSAVQSELMDSRFGDEETETFLKAAPTIDEDTPILEGASDKSRKIVIRERAVPSKQLTLRMIDLQGELDMINKRIMSGMSVDKEEWKIVRRLTHKLEQTFENVEFEWETKPKLSSGL